jgi:hypothetical protein
MGLPRYLVPQPRSGPCPLGMLWPRPFIRGAGRGPRAGDPGAGLLQSTVLAARWFLLLEDQPGACRGLSFLARRASRLRRTRAGLWRSFISIRGVHGQQAHGAADHRDSVHVGACAYSQGCYMAFRNPANHLTGIGGHRVMMCRRGVARG